jgi:3alpha(or 20beta)-hydroxysteroid dehydrogenase
MARLDGKVAIITGAARGQGAAHARRFVAEGAKVVIADVLRNEGITLAAELGDSALFARHDVTEGSSWEAVLEITIDSFGLPNVLVNNAGVVVFTPILEQEPDEFHRVIAVNLVGPLLGMKWIGRAMARVGGGSIVNICSTAALQGYHDEGAYCASKWALRGLTKTAALEFGSLGVRVNAVHPGPIATQMLRGDHTDERRFSGQPIRRAGRAEEVANMVVYLASDEASYSTGGDFVVDGGASSGQVPIREE